MSEPVSLTDEALAVHAMLDLLKTTTGAVVLRKEVEGHLIAIVLPSLRGCSGPGVAVAAALWEKCADTLQEFVDIMRRNGVCG